jgi:hypothetical protein
VQGQTEGEFGKWKIEGKRRHPQIAALKFSVSIFHFPPLLAPIEPCSLLRFGVFEKYINFVFNNLAASVV